MGAQHRDDRVVKLLLEWEDVNKTNGLIRRVSVDETEQKRQGKDDTRQISQSARKRFSLNDNNTNDAR